MAKKKAIPMISSREECELVMGQLRVATLARAMAQAGLEAEIARVKEEHGQQIIRLTEETKALTAQLQKYYMAHLEELEQDGRKSVDLRHGVMGRRLNPSALKLLNKAWTWAAVLSRLIERRRKHFVRWPDPEIDKEAIKKADLGDQALAELGMMLSQDEVFFAEPYGAEDEAAG